MAGREKMKKLFIQLFRFGVVGGSAFLIDYGIMVFLTEFGKMNYLLSSGISFAVSVIYNYVLSINWVFEVKKDQTGKRNFIYFLLLSIIGLGINEILMWIFVEALHIYYMAAKIGVTFIVMVYNFITRKIFLERN